MSTNTIAIHLPDGAVREVPAGTTPLEIANSISPRLAAASVVARLTPLAANGGRLVRRTASRPMANRAKPQCMRRRTRPRRGWWISRLR